MAKKAFVLRSAFNYDADLVSTETGLVCPESDTVVQQQFADECDINTIVRRFGLTGDLPSTLAMPVSGDFTDISDFHSAMNMVRSAEEAFMAMPASVRQRFGGDPQAVMEFLENPSNRDEAIKLGLVNPPVEVPRDAVKAIDELASVLKPKV